MLIVLEYEKYHPRRFDQGYKLVLLVVLLLMNLTIHWKMKLGLVANMVPEFRHSRLEIARPALRLVLKTGDCPSVFMANLATFRHHARYDCWKNSRYFTVVFVNIRRIDPPIRIVHGRTFACLYKKKYGKCRTEELRR